VGVPKMVKFQTGLGIISILVGCGSAALRLCVCGEIPFFICVSSVLTCRAEALRRRVCGYCEADVRLLISGLKFFQKSHLFGSGNRNFFRPSAIIGVDMNKFVKKLGCTERMTNCPCAIFSRNNIKDHKRS
jgi:hypothetical protein